MANLKKRHYRKCIFTHTIHRKEEMLRLVWKNGVLIMDHNHELQGRGFYLHKNPFVLHGICQKKRLDKIFKQKMLHTVYEELQNLAKALSITPDQKSYN